MNNEQLAEFDNDRIMQFERDWLDGQPRKVGQYLPEPSDFRYLGTLQELVHIDLEFRWKEYQKNPSPQRLPPAVESYLESYPQLESVKLSLIQSEFELANLYGARPSVQQFIDRFGDQVGDQPIRPVLQLLLSEIQTSKIVKPGTTIGRYEINNEHGRGGFGAVWRATDTKLGRRIAVKQLGQRLATDAQSRRRFISEARVTAKLEHPGIVPVYDISSQEDDYAYYTMRLIQGRTMAEAIDDLHQLDPKSSEFELLRQRLLQSFVDACQTTHYAHSQGVIHRDLKPQNMIVGDYGETILLDWGLASVIDQVDPTESILLHSDPEVLTQEESVETLRGTVMGTPAYMPPEQANGELATISRRSDVYSLGATLYHLITGHVPFTDGPLDELLDRVKSGELPAAHKLNPTVEPPLSAIAAKAMHVAPRDRYRNSSELLQDVQKFLADQPVSAYQDPWMARATRWLRRNPTTAAMLAMTTLFLFLAVTATVMIRNAFHAREEKRITNLQIAAERADATAISQIQTGRFDSAAEMLGESLELIEGEPRLAEFAGQLKARQERTRKIVDFYRFSMKAQEETFFDRTGRSATYCQAAVDQLGVLSNPDWWADLPAQDLTPSQVEQLRTEVYRILGLLSSMRLAQTAESAFSFDVLTDTKNMDPKILRSNLIKAAGFAASQGNRFREARGMRIIEEVGQVASGDLQGVDLANINPLNSIDSAMMGSILDNNVPREGVARTAISTLLNFRDPNQVARDWLDDGLKYNPDWYWLPVFMGVNQINTGKPQEGIKTLSHAIGIRPDYWVGYQYRAWACLVAAELDGVSRKQRTALLNSATRDVQRAMDLEKNKSELHWIQAVALYQNGAGHGQINQTFLKALALRPKLSEISEGHYSAVTKLFFELATRMTNEQDSAGEKTSQLYQLRSAMKLWQGEHDEALAICQVGLDEFPDAPNLQRLKKLIILDQDPRGNDRTPIDVDSEDRFAWHFYMANARLHQNRSDLPREATQLERAVELAKSDWQNSAARLQLARNRIESGQPDQAIALIDAAVSLDRAADLSTVAEMAEQLDAKNVTTLCAKYKMEFEPKTQFDEPAPQILRPALMNGGFELGLSFYWSPFAQRQKTATWNNSGESKTVTETSSGQPHSGQSCLSIELDSPVDADSFGIMSQSIPVTPGVTYEVSFWARSQRLSENGVRVGDFDPNREQNPDSVSLDGGTYAWRPLKFNIKATENSLPLSIWAQGSGRVWLDDFSIRKVDNDSGG